jgi:hypothetical protein
LTILLKVDFENPKGWGRSIMLIRTYFNLCEVVGWEASPDPDEGGGGDGSPGDHRLFKNSLQELGKL